MIHLAFVAWCSLLAQELQSRCAAVCKGLTGRLRAACMVVCLAGSAPAATHISMATGNFTAVGTWATLDTSSGSEVDSEAGTINISTANIDSPTSTPGAITIDGVAIKISSRLSTGTITLSYRDAGAQIDAVTVNVTDLPNNGWAFFKFASSQVLVPATTYFVRLVCSNTGNQVVVYRSTTGTNNMSKMVRTTSNPGSLAASDKFMMMGEMTAAGAATSFTVTNDNTATTSWGPTVSGGPPQGMTVSRYSTFTWGTAASTSYYLKLKGVLAVYDQATMSLGTSGTPMPGTSTAVLEFDSAANVDSGLEVFSGGQLYTYGAPVTTVATLMTADRSAAATTLVVSSTAGWAANDVLAIASTTRTAADCESKTILTVDSGVQVTLTAGLTNAHSGTSPTQAEVANLTRNVKIRGISTSLQGYVWLRGTSSNWSGQYAEFYQLGSATTNKLGIEIATTTGTVNVQYSSFHDGIVAGSSSFMLRGTAPLTAVISNNVFYNLQTRFFQSTAGGTGWTFSGNVGIRSLATTSAANLGSTAGTFNNNRIVGSGGVGVLLDSSGSPVSFDGNTIHSTTSYGIEFNALPIAPSVFSNLVVYRAASRGIYLSGTASANSSFGLTFNTLTLFGNSTANFTFGQIQRLVVSSLVFTDAVMSGDSTFGTLVGIDLYGTHVIVDWQISNSTFGVAGGIKVAHTNADIQFGATMISVAQLTCSNCNLASTVPVFDNSSIGFAGQRATWLRFAKWAQTAGSHRMWVQAGVIRTDTAISHSASPSQRLTPNMANQKLESAQWAVPVQNAATITFSVWARKSVAGDTGGAEYNGNQPRLIVRRSDALGITSDTVLDTMTVANGTWEQLSGTTAAVTDDGVLEAFVDSDGTAGWINVDDWGPAGALDPSGQGYWLRGLPAGSILVSAAGMVAPFNNPILFR